MKISLSKPPIWEEANKFFKLEELGLGTIFCFGSVIYNPSGVSLTQDLIVHESTHAEQQGHDETVARLWWRRYFEDPAFRLEQEAEAYGAQYRFLCTQITDRNAKVRQLGWLADQLSGPMYGKICGKFEAMNLIRKQSLIHRVSTEKKATAEV